MRSFPIHLSSRNFLYSFSQLCIFGLFLLSFYADTVAQQRLCITLRGQRFGGQFGDPIGDGTNGRGVSLPGNAVLADGGTANGGISAATANAYGPFIGPFKAGIPTIATIIAEIVDENDNVVTTFSTGAALRIDTDVLGLPLPASWNAANYPAWTFPAQLASVPGVVSRNGRFEWTGVQINGVAATNHTITVYNAFVGADANGGTRNNPIELTAAQGALSFCEPFPVQISVQGGGAFSGTLATQTANPVGAINLAPGATGPIAVPGVIQTRDAQGNVVGALSGSAPFIIVGERVNFGNAFAAPNNNAVTIVIRDRFSNLASFTTDATITLASGRPPIDPLATPMIGNQVLGSSYTLPWTLGNPNVRNGGETRTDTGQRSLPRTVEELGVTLATFRDPRRNRAALASPALPPSGAGYPPITNPQVGSHFISFPNYEVWGATSNNVQLTVNIQEMPGSSWASLGCLGNTVATVTLHPAPARGIAPVIQIDKFDSSRVRAPSRFALDSSNANDSAQWFAVQAVDEFGNTCSQGPNIVNGNRATVRLAPPNEGLPRNRTGTFQFSAPDFHTKVNNQNYRADGMVSAPAVNGLYLFNNFTPRGVASAPFAVCLTFEDSTLQGLRQPRTTGTNRPLFQPIPPITTATTQFLAPVRVTTSVRSVADVGEITLSLAPNPVTERLTLEWKAAQAGTFTVRILNVVGEECFRRERRAQQEEDQTETLDVAGLPAGVYAVEVWSSAGKRRIEPMSLS